MSRISQGLAYINLSTKELTNDWIKTNLTDITISKKLKQVRAEFIRSKHKDKK